MPTSEAIDASNFNSIPDAIAAFRAGNFVVVLDDPSRENEADLIAAAATITTAQMAFLVRYSSGYVCAPLAPALADAWALPPMVADNQDPRGTAYTVAVDAAHPSVTTGISARDRALTCRVLARGPDGAGDMLEEQDEDETRDAAGQDDEGASRRTGPSSSAKAHGVRSPGHVLPLRARVGGVRQRPGHTEAAVELCRLAGLAPAGVIGELVDDGVEVPGRAVREQSGMMRGEACVAFGRAWGLPVITIADLVAYVDANGGNGL